MHASTKHRFSAALVAAATALAGLVIAVATPAAATPQSAAELPVTVAGDALPTVQVDGVVWDQEVVGNVVYVVGKFTTARPAGAAPGVNTVQRSNVLAYDLTTGALLPNFVADTNAQVVSVSAAPDGKTVYIAGDFTKVNGVTKYRIAALNPTTGAVITKFHPIVNFKVGVVLATADTVYFGGAFTAVNNTARLGAAAVYPASGTLKPWAPAAEGGRVSALVLSPDGSKVVLGGSFTTLNGSSDPGYGLGAVDTVTGASLPWAANSQVRNAGANSSITSLKSDANGVYGAGYHYGDGGNLEGTFFATWDTGQIQWLEDCHGDTYDMLPTPEVVYVAGHPHYCGNVVGGFPQTDPWQFHYALAFTNGATGTLGHDPHGYHDWFGTPSPTLLPFYPDFTPGTYTGKTQAAWSIAGNGDYVLWGGEFTAVNGKRQQGLVRMAARTIAPNKEGPVYSGGNYPIAAASFAAGTVRVTWQGNWDVDDSDLTYTLYRGSKNSAPIDVRTVPTRFWDTGTLSFIDSGLTPGSTQRYLVTASDPWGNVVSSDWASVTVASAGSTGPYVDTVLADSPSHLWRLGETGGALAFDWAGLADLTVGTGVTGGQSGAISGNSASQFSGTVDGLAATTEPVLGPQVFSVEAWVNTTSTAGGKIVGFGNANTGTSSSYDRHLYLDTSGKVNFGVWNGSSQILTSTKAINDGQWHQVVASMSSAGTALYVDGVRVARNPGITQAQSFNGYWRIGGDSTWSGAQFLSGLIDDVSVYDAALSGSQVQAHYTASGRVATIPAAPTDAYGKAVFGSEPDLYWRLGESTGTVAADASAAGNPGVYRSGATLGQPSAVAGTGDTSVRFNGTSGLVSTATAVTNPTVYSEELWFSTTSTNGGKLIGFGSAATGLSGSYDRHVILRNDGKLTFGVYTGQMVTITSPSVYNDGAWHHLVATQGADGMKLYVDGALVASGAETRAQAYTGYWRIGGDNSWGTQAWFNGSIDEVAVYSTVLDAATVASHHEIGRTGIGPNALPTARITTSMVDQQVTVDGSSSSDPDGSALSYAWDFGDGATGSGATAAHTYGSPGDYTVTLTVTDERSGTSVATAAVTAVAPNQPPTVSFTGTVTDLATTFDASGSGDSDGSITSYAWTFGDGGTATGVTAGHSYAAAGTYPVTLTVTDDKGATATATADVTVTAPVGPQPLAGDLFGRSVSSGWGSADLGGAWTKGGSGTVSVAGGLGLHKPTVGGTLRTDLSSVQSTTSDVTVAVSSTGAITGGGAYVHVVGRRVAGTDLQARVKLLPSGSVGVALMRGSTSLAAVVAPGLTYVDGDSLQIRLQVTGTDPTQLRVKVWKTGTAEPSTWLLETTDATAAVQAPGSVGIVSYLTGSASALTLTYDNLTVTTVP